MAEEPLIRQQFRCPLCQFRPNNLLWGDAGEPTCFYHPDTKMEPVGPPVVIRAASEEEPDARD